ncbi:MAG: tautomerase family protein [Chloroflexi bacterium]|nr:tautomerase family protein [Chloroflexota bacterium]
MPIVRVEMWTGRTVQQKADLAKAITEAVCRIAGSPPEATFVVFTDIAKDNWAQAGVIASQTTK